MYEIKPNQSIIRIFYDSLESLSIQELSTIFIFIVLFLALIIFCLTYYIQKLKEDHYFEVESLKKFYIGEIEDIRESSVSAKKKKVMKIFRGEE
jgi:hypothetical protein